jgi:hypothetical protein
MKKHYILKYENSTLKIYIRTIKHYTDIDPTVDFVFPVNKIHGENTGARCVRKKKNTI